MIASADKYHFDDEAGALAVEFFEECLVHVQGPMSGQPFKLLPWQADFIGDLFGWKDTDTGLLRYTKCYAEVPRKNGKTTLLAGLGLYLLLKAEHGGQIIGCASSLDQAAFLYDIAAEMVNRAPAFLKRKFEVLKSKKRIVHADRNAYYRAIPADPDKIHGARPFAVLFDELHKQPNRNLWDALRTGMGTSEWSLFASITTAGHDRSSICWEQHEYARKVQSGEITDEKFYPLIYAADESDDWRDPAIWAKANPSLNSSVLTTFLREECEVAKVTPAYENTFRNLYLNQWTEQAVRFMPMEYWDQCDGEIPDLTGEDCYAGLDMASTRDLASLVLVFRRGEMYYAIPFFWAPREAATARDRQDRQGYRGWEGQYITLTEGNSIDQSVIRAKMFELAEKYNILNVAFDDWNMTECYQQLLRDGWPEDRIGSVGQNHGNYNEPMKKSVELVRDGNLAHAGHPVLRWNAANVVAKEDHNGNFKPDKGKSQDKIDGYCAFLMGLGLALEGPQLTTGSYLVI